MTWSKLAEISAQSLHKGSHVYVAGRLHIFHWEDAQTGEQRSSIEIVVVDLILLDRPTPMLTPEDEQDAGEVQPNTAMRAHAQVPSTRSAGHPQPVQLRNTGEQPSKRHRNDR